MLRGSFREQLRVHLICGHSHRVRAENTEDQIGVQVGAYARVGRRFHGKTHSGTKTLDRGLMVSKGGVNRRVL